MVKHLWIKAILGPFYYADLIAISFLFLTLISVVFKRWSMVAIFGMFAIFRCYMDIKQMREKNE